MSWVHFEGQYYPASSDESVLDALIRGGANVSYSCRKGSCHSCLLQVVGDTASPLAQARLSPELQTLRMFLPCQTPAGVSLSVQRPDLSGLFRQALVAEKQLLTSGIIRLLLEPPGELAWCAGQFVNLRSPHGDIRSYSIASVAQRDYFLELHVQHYPGGRVSEWLLHTVQVGDWLDLQGPYGGAHYHASMADSPLLMIATGTGAGALLGVAREALLLGHGGPISFYHGARDPKRLYCAAALQQMQVRYPRFVPVCCVSGGDSSSGDASSDEVSGADSGIGARAGRATDVAFAEHPVLEDTVVFLRGDPAMVTSGQGEAKRRGASPDQIYADAFSPSPAL